MNLNIGLTDEQRKQIADGLAKVLADSYSLYIKKDGEGKGTDIPPAFRRHHNLRNVMRMRKVN